jgi:hypothetical protein
VPLTEGTDPADLGPIDRLPNQPTAAEQPAPSFLDVAAAAERSSNLAGTLYDRLSSPSVPATPTPGFDPATSVPKGYEQYADRFLDDESPEQIAQTKQRIDAELQDRQTLARAGKLGFVASLAAGMTDPLTLASMLIPVGGETRLARAGYLAAQNAGVTAVQEGIQQRLSLTRTPEESMWNIGGSALLGGVLGAVIRPHVPVADASRLTEGLNQELHNSNSGEQILGPTQRSVLDTPLPSDFDGELPESFFAGLEQPKTPSPLEEQFREELSNHVAATERYAALDNPQIADSQGGKILNVDFARELSPEYAADRTRSAEVHEPASEFVKRMYADRLAEEPQEGELPLVTFTAGGTGAGKTTSIKNIPEVHDLAQQSQIVYDTNMSNFDSSTTKIDQALDANKGVHVVYVYRDPEEALVKGALPRAERMGRTVPIEEHAKTHAGSFETIRRLQEHYADNGRVKFSIIDNSRGKDNAALSSMEDLAEKRYNMPVKELRNALENERQAGRISEATYRGTAGVDSRGGEGRGELPPEDRPSPGGQPEPQREAGQPGQVEPGAGGTGYVNPNDESTAGAAAVANTTMQGERIASGARTLAEGTVGHASPGLRVLSSRSLVARRLVQDLANTPEQMEKNRAGVATAQPVERALWKYEGTWYQAWKARRELFRAYRKRVANDTGNPRSVILPPLTRRQFNEMISSAMRRGDQSPVPEVAEAARRTRAIIFDPLKERAQKLGLLPKDLQVTGADSYLMRQYDPVKIRQNKAAWLDTLTEGFQAQGVERAEARDIAYQVNRNVLGSERGTMDWKVLDEAVPASGQTKERTLRLPDELLEPYLNSDIDHLSHSYLRSMAPEVEFTERFGSRDMADQLGDVKDDYARMMERAIAAGKDPAPIEKELNGVMRDLSAIRDRLYGIYGQPKDPGSLAVRAGRLLRSDNALRLLGGATLAHFPDLANVIVKHGMPRTFGAIGKLLTSWQAMKLAGDEAKRMGAALDMTMNLTASVLGDYGSHSQFAEQRAMAKITRFFTIATGETPLITVVQGLTSTLAQDEILRAADAVSTGATLSSRATTRLAAAGLDEGMLRRIAQEASVNARQVNGLKFGMSDTWKDQQAAAAFESAVLRDAHGVTLRPGAGDTPLFMSSELGKSILQFQTFAYAASRIVVNPLLQGLATGDLRAIQGIFALSLMGSASYVTKQLAAGQPIELDNPGRLALEVLDKSNLLGWMGQIIFPALWQLGMKDLSRWSDRDAVETLLGPSAGTVASAYARRLLSRTAPGDDQGNSAESKPFSRADLHFVRRLMPGQNLWYFRRQVNALEDAVGDAFDLPGQSNEDRAAQQVAAR